LAANYIQRTDIMDSAIRAMVDWEQPFSADEYAGRRARVKAALENAGYDGIVVTAPRDYYYLSGHDHIWQYRYAVTGLYFDTASGSFVFFDNASHRNVVSTTPEITDVTYGPRKGDARDHVTAIAAQLLDRGYGKGRIAIQTWSYGLHPDLVRFMGECFSEKGAEIVEDDIVIEEVRLYKTEAEIAVMREAGSHSRRAMAKARDAMAPGMMEYEIDAIISHDLLNAGCGHPGIRNMIGSGARSGDHHGPAFHRALKSGDIVHIDFSASLHRYHANLSRSFAVGDADPRWHDLMDRSAGCSQAIVDGVQAGDPFSHVQTAADAFIAASGVDRATYEWFIGGYVLGIAFPPDWVDHHRPQPFDAAPDPVMKPGMVFNFEVQYDVFEGWPGGSGAGWIDSYLMTENGLEIITDMPRELVVVGN
jgi:Xaa-Pro aminopeptidase